MKNLKTKPENNWGSYLIKARQFYESAIDAFQKENWNAVCLNAIHAGISANDAITVYFLKQRSASDKHSDVVVLLLEAHSHSDDAKNNSKHLQWLINRKNIVEYEARLFYKKEAEDAVKHSDRYIEWANKILPAK